MLSTARRSVARPAFASGVVRRATLVGLLLLFVAVSLLHLDRLPPVFEDEPWQASTGWSIARDGVFGSDMFTGYCRSHPHDYGRIPLDPRLLAGPHPVAGIGVEQMRLEATAMALATLLLTWLLARRLFDDVVALLGVAMLVIVRLLGTSPVALTGIPLVDGARIARYDIVVPVFGLGALLAYVHARDHSGWLWYAATGLLAALAGLSHVYGAFWIIALALLALWDRARPLQLAVLAFGFVAPCLGYLAYVLPHLDDWRGQTRIYSPRFELLDVSWHVSNVLDEYHRYGPGLGPFGWGWLTRPGFWAALVVLPASLVALARRGMRGDCAARAIVVPAMVIPTLFAPLLYVKQASYLLTVVPLGAIAAAWGVITLWRRLPPANWLRVALATLGLLLALEGLAQVRGVDADAARTTPYDAYVARLRVEAPSGARVLGVHTWWLGFHDADFRAWLVPLLEADPRYAQPPLPIDAALDRVNPDVVLIDAELRAVLDARPDLGAGVAAWLAGNGLTRVATIDDPTWGATEVYRRDPPDGG